MAKRKTFKKEVKEAKKEIKDVFKFIYRRVFRAAFIKVKHACGYLLCLPNRLATKLEKVGKRLLKAK